jgi:hypothetical protein
VQDRPKPGAEAYEERLVEPERAADFLDVFGVEKSPAMIAAGSPGEK